MEGYGTVCMEPVFTSLPTAATYQIMHALINLNVKLKFSLKASFSLILILLDSDF